MGLFSRKSKKDCLQAEYMRLLVQAKDLSTVNRKESDRLIAEADKIAQEIEKIVQHEGTK